jgi:hypothetical protein
LPAIGLLIVLAASIAGLLCARIHPYDDGILLLGARLVSSGWLPFRDFYTHYGPLGFGVQSLFSGAIAEPGAALRVGQATGLAALAALAAVLARRSCCRPHPSTRLSTDSRSRPRRSAASCSPESPPAARPSSGRGSAASFSAPRR